MPDEEQLLYRAQSLMELQRYDQALEMLQGVLAMNPEHGQALLMLLVCRTQLGHHQQAIELAQDLLGRFPEEPLLYQLLAANYAEEQRFDEAKRVAEQGLTIAPGDVDLLASLGQIALIKKDWPQALYYAEEALELAPEHLTALNIRLTALNKLGRKEEIRASLEDTLAADPNNPYTHNNIGWTQLEAGNHEQAKHHFAEALRLQPSLEQARIGLLESLKAKNFLYRGFLSWMFFMSKQKEQAQWFIIIGAYLGYQLLGRMTAQYPFLLPVVYLLLLLFYLTWIIHPLSNVLIKLDRVARHALTEVESRAATIVGLGVLMGFSLLGVYLVIGNHLLLLSALFVLSIIIPMSMYYDFIGTNRESIAWWSMLGLGALGATSLGLVALDSATSLAIWQGDVLWTGYFLGFLAYQFAANYWRMRSYRVD